MRSRRLRRWRRNLYGAAVVTVIGAGVAGEAIAENVASAPVTVPPLVRALWPDLPPDAVQPAPIGADWLEIATPEGQVVYLDPSQRYAIIGQALDLWTRRNLSTERLERERAVSARAIADGDVLWIKPEGTPAGRLYVFDDPDCPYCRQAHPHLAELAASGIELGVVLYPITRLHPEAYGKSVSIWCAADPRNALDRAMQGEAIESPATPCAHPIDRNMQLGRRMGVTGTPYWVAANGRALSGLRSVEELRRLAEGR